MTVCSVLPIPNDFRATGPVVGPQAKQQELQTAETSQQDEWEGTTTVTPSLTPWFLYSLCNEKSKGRDT